ncbi:hypothetical protein [Streptomyces yangpuensis]|uniref:hypothetical protein n=1 Tax=Streptomyces yangpuensis TaxID=1648182 RepID=UPI0036D0415F
MVVPYAADIADDPAFASAGLLFRGGQPEFSADAAYAWLSARAASRAARGTV